MFTLGAWAQRPRTIFAGHQCERTIFSSTHARIRERVRDSGLELVLGHLRVLGHFFGFLCLCPVFFFSFSCRFSNTSAREVRTRPKTAGSRGRRSHTLSHRGSKYPWGISFTLNLPAPVFYWFQSARHVPRYCTTDGMTHGDSFERSRISRLFPHNKHLSNQSGSKELTVEKAAEK